jgi:hypothetical protein
MQSTTQTTYPNENVTLIEENGFPEIVNRTETFAFLDVVYQNTRYLADSC